MALKVGTEDKKKVAIAASLGAVVVGLLIYTIYTQFFQSSPAPAAPVAATAPAPSAVPVSGPAQRRRTSSSTATGHEAVRVGSSMEHLDPTLHPEIMAAAESLEYSGKGRNIFSMTAAPPPIEVAKASARPAPVVPQGPAPPPPPPPIDLKFFGFEAVKSGSRKAFLLHGDDVFIAAEGDVVDHRYKVVKIAPLSLQVEDIPYHNTQTLPLVQN